MGALYQNVPPPLETPETGPIGPVQTVGRHKFSQVLQYSDFYSQCARTLTLDFFFSGVTNIDRPEFIRAGFDLAIFAVFAGFAGDR